jgi:hypothetical protein
MDDSKFIPEKLLKAQSNIFQVGTVHIYLYVLMNSKENALNTESLNFPFKYASAPDFLVFCTIIFLISQVQTLTHLIPLPESPVKEITHQIPVHNSNQTLLLPLQFQ